MSESLTAKIKRRLRQGKEQTAAPGSAPPDNTIWGAFLKDQAPEWQSARNRAAGPKVLIATSLGGHGLVTLLESSLAIALTMRGARVEILLCDQVLPACQLTKIETVSPETLIASNPQPRCAACQGQGQGVYEPLGLPIHWYSQYLTPMAAQQAHDLAMKLPVEEIGAYVWKGLAVGEHAAAGALRYFARGDLEQEPLAEPVLRRYLEAALQTVAVIHNLLDQNAYEVVCFHHGIYVPQGLIGEVCRQRGMRVVNWNPAYRKQTFVFSHGDTYHHTMITEATSAWEDIAWDARLEKITLDYLKSRWYGTQDWIWFHEKPREDLAQIVSETGLDLSRPCIGLLTSVMWDAQLHYQSKAFPNMLDWVLKTIEYFVAHPDLQLIIRIHPAEIRGANPARQRMAEEIGRAFPQLPPNIFVIPPESTLSTYALMGQCNSVLIYSTKTGIEVTSLGIPVVVAGEAWIRNKGFSLDANSPADYFSILDRLPLPARMNAAQVERSRKYAFHFFFRRMIPLPFVEWVEGFTLKVNLKNLASLTSTEYPGLDVICNGILLGTPFIYPAETDLVFKASEPVVAATH